MDKIHMKKNIKLIKEIKESLHMGETFYVYRYEGLILLEFQIFPT